MQLYVEHEYHDDDEDEDEDEDEKILHSSTYSFF